MKNELAKELIKSHGQEMFTTSLLIGERFGKQHKDVLRKIENIKCSDKFNQRNFTLVNYTDIKGESRPCYEITRDGFSFLAMGFTGKKAAIWKESFIEAFNLMEKEINRLYADPPRKDLLKEKRLAHHPMMQSLFEMREDLGKETKPHHYMCENKLCNFIVTGEFKKIDEKTLGNFDAELLKQVRRKNDAMLQLEIPYKERKERLVKMGIKLRTKLISKTSFI